MCIRDRFVTDRATGAGAGTASGTSGRSKRASGGGEYTAASIQVLSLIHISEPTRLLSISYAVFCLKKKKKKTKTIKKKKEQNKHNLKHNNTEKKKKKN